MHNLFSFNLFYKCHFQKSIITTNRSLYFFYFHHTDLIPYSFELPGCKCLIRIILSCFFIEEMFEGASSFFQDLCGWEIPSTTAPDDFCKGAYCGSCFTPNAAFLTGYNYSIIIFALGIAFVLHS